MKIGRVQQNLNDSGNVTSRSVYITQDVTLKKGDTIFLNDLEESLNKDVEFEYITEAEKEQKLKDIKARDTEYNRNTLFVAKLAKRKEA